MASTMNKIGRGILGAAIIFYLVGILFTDCCEVGSYNGPGQSAYYDQ